jgi:20S proteasome subunit beta 1
VRAQTASERERKVKKSHILSSIPESFRNSQYDHLYEASNRASMPCSRDGDASSRASRENSITFETVTLPRAPLPLAKDSSAAMVFGRSFSRSSSSRHKKREAQIWRKPSPPLRKLQANSWFTSNHMSAATCNEPPKTGTTIVACVYDGGVVLGADTRVSTGIYVSNRASDKMTVLADSTVMCRSGSAADTEAVAKIVRYHVEQIGMERDSPLDVKTVARISNQINYQNKSANHGAGLGAYMIIGGWDSNNGSQVFSCTAGGNMIATKWTTDGSGSTYIWGFMDNGFKENMTREECEEFVTAAITLAMSTDSSSGGCVRLNTVNADGIHRKLVKPDELVPVYGELATTTRHGHVGSSGGIML